MPNDTDPVDQSTLDKIEAEKRWLRDKDFGYVITPIEQQAQSEDEPHQYTLFHLKAAVNIFEPIAHLPPASRERVLQTLPQLRSLTRNIHASVQQLLERRDANVDPQAAEPTPPKTDKKRVENFKRLNKAIDDEKRSRMIVDFLQFPFTSLLLRKHDKRGPQPLSTFQKASQKSYVYL